jgi:hypothetical protein
MAKEVCWCDLGDAVGCVAPDAPPFKLTQSTDADYYLGAECCLAWLFNAGSSAEKERMTDCGVPGRGGACVRTVNAHRGLIDYLDSVSMAKPADQQASVACISSASVPAETDSRPEI